MAESNLARWDKKNPPRVEFIAMTDPKESVLHARFVVKNTTGMPILLFKPDPPLVRIEKEGRVGFVSLMPELTPFTRPIVPFIPKVVPLAPDELLEWKVDYVLPLRDTHPYAPGPVSPNPPFTKLERSKILLFVIGYFPEADGNDLYDGEKPGEKVPSYYELKRQLLASARPVELSVPVERTLFNTQ